MKVISLMFALLLSSVAFAQQPEYDISLADAAEFLRSQFDPVRQARLRRCEPLLARQMLHNSITIPEECNGTGDLRLLASYAAICEAAAKKERALRATTATSELTEAREDVARTAANCATWAWEHGFGEQQKPH